MMLQAVEPVLVQQKFDATTILLALVNFFGLVLAGIITAYMVRMSRMADHLATAVEMSQEVAAINAKAAVATADTVEKIHTAVNSERTEMLRHVNELKDEIAAARAMNLQLMQQLRAAMERPPKP